MSLKKVTSRLREQSAGDRKALLPKGCLGLVEYPEADEARFEAFQDVCAKGKVFLQKVATARDIDFMAISSRMLSEQEVDYLRDHWFILWGKK